MADYRDLIKKILQEHDPSIDLSGGTAASDILLNAPNYIIGYVLDAMTTLEDERDMTDVSQLDDPKLDRVGNQLFVPRSEGVKSTGVVRLYFQTPVSRTVNAGTVFETATGLQFISRQALSISSSEMALNIEGNLYFMDVTSVEAASAGSDYSINPFEIVRVVGGSVDVVKVTNPQAFTVGADRQSNEEYIQAITTGIAIRDLVVSNSIKTVLSQEFPQYPEYYVAGYRDTEMQRDFVYGLEIGGCVDIYPIVQNELEYQIERSPAVGITFNYDPVVFVRTFSINSDTGEDYTDNTVTGLPISSIISVERRALDGTYVELAEIGYLDNPPGAGTPYFMRVPLGASAVGLAGLPSGGSEFWNAKGYFKYGGLDGFPQWPHPDNGCLTHSIYEESVLVCVKNDGTHYGASDTFRVTYTGLDPAIARSMQTYVDNKDLRTIDADHLVRAMIPVTVDIDVRVVASDTVALETALSSLITNALTYDDITTAKVINALTTAGADTVDLPISISYSAFLPSGQRYSGDSATTGKLDLVAIREMYPYIGKNIRFSPGTITISTVLV